MKVRMNVHIGGFREGAAWPAVGELLELPDHQAADLIANGYAEEATDAEDVTPEADNGQTDTGDTGEDTATDDGATPGVDDKPVKPKARRKA